MSRNPYFAHLPTWRNRQDLAYALDNIPHILTSYKSCSISSASTYYPYPSPPSSPCSTFTQSYSSSSSHLRSALNTSRQHRLLQKQICSCHPSSSEPTSHNETCDMLRFSTRAQAMGFLIDILRSLQEEPCGCDLVQGCFCSPDGKVEDHSGMAPCYVCGEWYAEQVYCRDEETMEVYQVDGRRWHEQLGTSLRHHVAESRVRRWLDEVVVDVPPRAFLQRSRSMPIQRTQSAAATATASPFPPQRSMSMASRSGSVPASISIPQEILDPRCRSPGFRIKNKDVAAAVTPCTVPSSNSVTKEQEPESSLSTRFSFTSERFKLAVQNLQGNTPDRSNSTPNVAPVHNSVHTSADSPVSVSVPDVPVPISTIVTEPILARPNAPVPTRAPVLDAHVTSSCTIQETGMGQCSMHATNKVKKDEIIQSNFPFHPCSAGQMDNNNNNNNNKMSNSQMDKQKGICSTSRIGNNNNDNKNWGTCALYDSNPAKEQGVVYNSKFSSTPEVPTELGTGQQTETRTQATITTSHLISHSDNEHVQRQLYPDSTQPFTAQQVKIRSHNHNMIDTSNDSAECLQVSSAPKVASNRAVVRSKLWLDSLQPILIPFKI
ncbi:hypothetical protein BX616_003922 [Lobosporangium transversale]|nr:hypothetical protein BX616_003922 [Lobosporangium transversale]